MSDWNSPNWWDDMLMSSWTNRELTDWVIDQKKKRSEKLMLAPESYDFIILIAGTP